MLGFLSVMIILCTPDPPQPLDMRPGFRFFRLRPAVRLGVLRWRGRAVSKVLRTRASQVASVYSRSWKDALAFQ